MILGLIIWNIILSLLILILLLSLICICCDLDRKRRAKSRYEVPAGRELPLNREISEPTPGPSAIYSTVIPHTSRDPRRFTSHDFTLSRDPFRGPYGSPYAYDNKDMMHENRESNSDSYQMSVESMERLPSTHF